MATPLEAQEAKVTKTPRNITYLGTIKGEVSKVSDGGRKVEVKYKELVTTSVRSNSSSARGGVSGKYRPAVPKELALKEKSQELELRLLDTSIVRLLASADQLEDKTTSKKKASPGSGKKNMEGDSGDKKEEETDESKLSKKPATKSTKKPTEPSLPGKPGDPGSIVKGQIVIVEVAREDLPGFSRLIASTVYILGEK